MVERGDNQQGEEHQDHAGTDDLLYGPGFVGRARMHPPPKHFRVLHSHVDGVDRRQDYEYAEEDSCLPVVEPASRPEQRQADQRKSKH